MNWIKRLTAIVTTLALLTLALSPLLAGAAVPGRWNKVEKLDPGTAVSLELKAGDKYECTYLGLEDQAIRTRIAGEERQFPRGAVRRIVSLEKRGDSVLNGLAFGAVGGAAAGAGVGAAVFEPGDDREVGVAAFTLIGTGIGAALGALIDMGSPKVREEEILYLAG